MIRKGKDRRTSGSRAQLLRHQEPQAAVILEEPGLDHRAGPEGLVPVVLSLLSRVAIAGDRRYPDQALAQLRPPRRPDPRKLRARRYLLPPKTEAGASAMVPRPLHLGLVADRVGPKRRVPHTGSEQPQAGRMACPDEVVHLLS